MRAIVTGAASGIGRATAAALRARGATVVGIDLQGGEEILAADVRDQDQVDRAVGIALERLGGLDVLINCAGIGEPQDAGLPPDERAVATVETNFLGAWRVTGAAMPALLRSRGRVINIASGLAEVTVPLAAAYTASKRALTAYSDVLRLEYGDRISVTTVYPGYVETPIHLRSRAMGIRLGDAVPHDSMRAVVRTIVRACEGPPRRNVATSSTTAAGLLLARYLPGIMERLVRMRSGRALRARRAPYAPDVSSRPRGGSI